MCCAVVLIWQIIILLAFSKNYTIDFLYCKHLEPTFVATDVVVKPILYKKKLRPIRNINENIVVEDSSFTFMKIANFTFKLNYRGNMMLAPTFKSEWISANDNVRPGTIPNCEYTSGQLQNSKVAAAAFTICDSLLVTGYFDASGIAYFLQPLNETSGTHLLYASNGRENELRTKRSNVQFTHSSWIFNLTGDTVAINEDIDDNNTFDNKKSLLQIHPYKQNWNKTEQIQENMLLEDTYNDNGYFYDRAWVWKAFAPQETPNNLSILPQRWLEIALGVDHTVVAFHGRQKVEQYVLALMNIVSAIYEDPSLEANLKLVITRLTVFEHGKTKAIRPGLAKYSLENVNRWNRKIHANIKPGEARHDIAVWLTRLNIGGPSGYAPVAGVCDPKRSCAINKDEGLTSAFIIAHEVAHLLGLSHDGDEKSGNNCSDSADEGSVMAAMVSATFNKFSWSECSRREFRERASNWSCLSNPPTNPSEIILNATLKTAFNMDEQCNVEFGHGFSMCRSFDIAEPCTHLWCSHEKTPFVCKTKKGPPLEGTECGFGKWCINGYCEDVTRHRLARVPISLNPRDGQWGPWGSWGPCSRSCGTAVQFRQRQCDHPAPSYGGKPCVGQQEEWRLCKYNQPCPNYFSDIRAKQCKNLPKIMNLLGKSADETDTWLPFESNKLEEKCKLICLSEERQVLYTTNENLIDGTPCSYDNEDDICIQGRCYRVGCDGELNSEKRRDLCGVCDGNQSDCSSIKLFSKKHLKRGISRISVLPRMARKIKIEAKVSTQNFSFPNIAIILKNRRNKKYILIVPNDNNHSKIFVGANFYYERIENQIYIKANGPIQTEIIMMLIISNADIPLSLHVSCVTEYAIHKNFQKPSRRHMWIMGGWGSCSASCGGGKRQKTIACWDNATSKIVRRKFCSFLEKPLAEWEKCNTFSCNFQWISGKWEPCTKTCGTTGIQHREIYCVPSHLQATFFLDNNSSLYNEPWKCMVNPNKCADIEPAATVRSCNRKPCPSNWSFGQWSQCSVSCGPGLSSRTSTCLQPGQETFYTCGEAPPPQRRPCTKHSHCRTNICEDKSIYCVFKEVLKYCQINGFKRWCCKSCAI